MRLGEPGGLQRPEIVPPWPRGPARSAGPLPSVESGSHSPSRRGTRRGDKHAILSRPRCARCRMPPWRSSATKKLLTLVVSWLAVPAEGPTPPPACPFARSERSRGRKRERDRTIISRTALAADRSNRPRIVRDAPRKRSVTEIQGYRASRRVGSAHLAAAGRERDRAMGRGDSNGGPERVFRPWL